MGISKREAGKLTDELSGNHLEVWVEPTPGERWAAVCFEIDDVREARALTYVFAAIQNDDRYLDELLADYWEKPRFR